MAALGVVVGDIIFIAVAIFGLGILMSVGQELHDRTFSIVDF